MMQFTTQRNKEPDSGPGSVGAGPGWHVSEVSRLWPVSKYLPWMERGSFFLGLRGTSLSRQDLPWLNLETLPFPGQVPCWGKGKVSRELHFLSFTVAQQLLKAEEPGATSSQTCVCPAIWRLKVWNQSSSIVSFALPSHGEERLDCLFEIFSGFWR